MQSAVISARKLALLLLLRAPDSKGQMARPIIGITRLQKLVFLGWTKLGRISPSREIKIDFDFRPQRFGPADSGLYADLEFLIALGHIRRSRTPVDRTESVPSTTGQLNFDDLVGDAQSGERVGEELSVEEATEEEISFEYLMGDEEGAADMAAGERTEEWFWITQSGLKLVEHIELHLTPRSQPTFQRLDAAAREVRSAYGDWPLRRLLQFVYSNHPDMISESEIKNRVLGSSS